MRIKEIEARLAAIKQDIEARGESMTAEEINALEQETTQLTEERAGLIAAAEKRNGILDNIAKGAGIVSRSFQQNNGDDNTAPDDPFGTPEYRSAWLKNIRRLPLNDAEKRAFSNASGAGAEVIHQRFFCDASGCNAPRARQPAPRRGYGARGRP